MAEDAPTPAVTANVSLVTNYLYRGISQSGNKPALQGGFDYTHSSGFYAGVWGSSISWISDEGAATNAGGVELDTYIGFKNSFAADFNYDVGFLRYNYPASYPNPMNNIVGTTPFAKADTNEVYGLIGWKWISLKYSYSLGSTFTVPGASGTNYIDLSANYPIPDTTYTLGAHYGKQTYKGTAADALSVAGMDPTYSDYRLSVAKDLGSGFSASLTYSKTNASAFYTVNGKQLGKGTGVLALTRTF
jgi:uncharacterized protein (TIGR02001 family)